MRYSFIKQHLEFFPFSRTFAQSRLESSWPYYFPITGGRRDGFIPFTKTLVTRWNAKCLPGFELGLVNPFPYNDKLQHALPLQDYYIYIYIYIYIYTHIYTHTHTHNHKTKLIFGFCCYFKKKKKRVWYWGFWTRCNTFLLHQKWLSQKLEDFSSFPQA